MPLGATWIEEEQAFNFAVYAEHAESVTLLLYSADEFGKPDPDVPIRFRPQQVRTNLALQAPPQRNARCSLLCLLGLGTGCF